MKTTSFFLFILFIATLAVAQPIPFQYSVKLKPKTISQLPGLHSFVVAESNGKWLVIGGRKDGLHARQPFNAFPASSSNTDIYVIDIITQQFWSTSVNSLATGLKEQLQSTNMNFFQDDDSLYLVGGYGYSNTAIDHITYPNLTSVSVSGLINAIINGSSISPYFKQITDQKFAVNGGQLGKIDSVFYLVGGHRFDGRYNPMGNPTYTQTYVDGIRKFGIHNSGTQLSITNYTTITDQVHLHRRDYNLVPQIFPNGEEGYTLSSGVFQIGVDLPFLYPVDIKSGGHTPQPSFNQYLSNYHSATAALYDSANNVMHSLFFGGMSQYYYLNNTLTQDNNVPFVKTISRVSRDANGTLQESVFPTEMAALIGASAEFIPNQSLPHYRSEIIKLSKITADSFLVGHIYGGIHSTMTNPFTSNQTSTTDAHAVIYEVWLTKNQNTGVVPLEGKNPLKITLFPNPSKRNLHFTADLPYAGDISIYIMDISGKIIYDQNIYGVPAGKQTLDISEKIKLSKGVYSCNFVFDGKYSASEKIVILD